MGSGHPLGFGQVRQPIPLGRIQGQPERQRQPVDWGIKKHPGSSPTPCPYLYITPPTPCPATKENREQFSEKEIEMGRSRMEETRCKRHPKHQSKGVCPFCVRERLSGLLAASSSGTYACSSSVSSSPYSTDSDLSSSATTPPYHGLKRAKLSLLFKPRGDGGRLVGISEPLTKSRSLAFALGGNRNKEDKHKEQEEKEKGKEKKNKRKFWSKLFGASWSWRSREHGGVSLHSRTIKEKSFSFV